MADVIEADPESMRTVIDELATAADGIDGELAALDQTLNALMGAWSGDAANAYQTAQVDWNSSMGDMRTLLNSVISVLSSVTSRYEETESAVIRDCA